MDGPIQVYGYGRNGFFFGNVGRLSLGKGGEGRVYIYNRERNKRIFEDIFMFMKLKWVMFAWWVVRGLIK